MPKMPRERMQQQVETYLRVGWTPVAWRHHPPIVKQAIRAAHIRPHLKECWRNSQLLLIRQDIVKFRYFEGVVTFLEGHPVQHAWLTLPDGTVVDPTLEDPPSIILCYEYSHETVYNMLVQTGMHGPIDPPLLDLAEACARLRIMPEAGTEPTMRRAIAQIQQALDAARLTLPAPQESPTP